MKVNFFNIIKNTPTQNIIEQKGIKCAIMATGALAPLTTDVFQKEPKNMTYDIEKINLFRKDCQK